jgi:hypothetical protein
MIFGVNIVERWSPHDLLHLEIGSPELDLMSPIFDTRSGTRIAAISLGKFCSNFAKFELTGMQEFNKIMQFQFQ